MELIFCGKRVARTVLVLYKYCPYFCDFVGICSNLVFMWKRCVYCPNFMQTKTRIKELREMAGMNRKDFCKYFNIPYRTVTEWELDNRHAPEYVLRLLEYYIRHENFCKESEEYE